MHDLPKVLDELFGDRVCSSLNFGEKAENTPLPVNDELADAVCDLLQARIALRSAQNKERGYTGQYNDSDYWQMELDVYNRAVDRFAAAVKAVLNG